ncbi:MAG: M14 family metallopeptidase [Gemmatimonadota bacterium]|jgi:hypothetical protein
MPSTPRDPRLRVLALAVLLGLPAPASAAPPQEAPPSPADVLGWELGERFTQVGEVVRYMEALADASARVSMHGYGRSWEDRPLVRVVIAREDILGDLDSVLARNRELTDPDTPAARASEIARSNPAVVYFSYGVHGNESSSSEAAMWTAWDLAREAPEVAGVLDSVVVVIDPVVNPDGRNRYVSFYRGARGVVPDVDPEAREHREPWPGGRTNHYLFDLNRDWAWMSQIETRARLSTWDRWNPQVHVDFHEMSWRSTYFFFPPAEPVNPVYPDHTREWARRIGQGNADAFDRAGWLYFTGESYDLFYPGYGDSWPSLLGSVGMTYEQAGGGFAGLAVERPDGTVLTLEDRASHHRTAGEATLRTVARGKSDLLEGFAAFHRGVDEGLPDILLVPGRDGESPGRFLALLELLSAQGIRYQVADAPFETGEARPYAGWESRRRFPVGTVRVPARQPRGRLALTLLQPETRLDATYSYDISAWSLPYGFGVEAHVVDGAVGDRWSAVDRYTLQAARGGVGRAGALLPPGFHGMTALGAFLEDGGRAVVLEDSFRLGGHTFPRGTIYLARALNADLEARVENAGLAALVEPAASGWTEVGPDLGTREAGVVTMPRIALLGGEGTSSGSFGAHWYFLEHRLGVPFDAVNAADLADLDLSGYDVVIAPDGGGLARVLGDAGGAALEEWVRGGGRLVAVGGGASALASRFDVEARTDPMDDGTEEEQRVLRALRTREERELARWESRTPGTVLQVQLDPGHPLAFGASADGTPGRAFVLSTGRSFEPAEGLETVAHFAGDVEKVSGVISTRTLDRLARSAWLVQRGVGGGSVVLFADDPLFRMMWYGGFAFYANAVLLTPVS